MITLLATLLINYSISLTWDKNSESNIGGYTVYYGTTPHAYTTTIDVGNITLTRIDNLDPGTWYYFAVDAYSTEGLHSDPSEEIRWKSPTTMEIAQGKMTVVLPTGQTFLLEKTSDFIHWEAVQLLVPKTQNEMVIPLEMTEEKAFYRILLLDLNPQVAMQQALRAFARSALANAEVASMPIMPPKIKKESWWKYNPRKYLKPKQSKGAFK